jgi:hypothetical protein
VLTENAVPVIPIPQDLGLANCDDFQGRDLHGRRGAAVCVLHIGATTPFRSEIQMNPTIALRSTLLLPYEVGGMAEKPLLPVRVFTDTDNYSRVFNCTPAAHRSRPGSIAGHVIWNLEWGKWHWGWFSPST